MTPKELFDQVVSQSPGFGLLLQEHLRDNDELLPHVLMPRLLQYVGSHFTQIPHMNAAPPNLIEVIEIVALLDAELAMQNSDTENLISVSFVEYIETEAFFPKLSPYLGPHIVQEHARQQSLHPAA